MDNSPSASDIHELLTLFNQGHYSETESRARELIASFPDHGFGWKVLGVVLRRQGQIIASLPPMQKAAELLSDDAEAHSNLGVVLMNQGLLLDAVNSYRRALALEPNYTDVHYHLGLTLMTLGELSEAEQCYQRVLALNPNYPDVHYNLGRIFQEQTRLSEAEECYRRVLDKHPQHSDVHSNLAGILHQQGRWDEAEASYQQALALNPHDIKAYSQLGLMLQHQGRLTEALDCYQCVLEINPQSADILNNLGMVFHKLGLDYEAEASYQQALAVNPDHAEVYNHLGLSLQAQGRWTKAEAAYRKALAIDSNYAEAYNNLGALFQQRGQFIEALASYRHALTIQANYAQAHHNLGKLYQDLGRLTEAEACIQYALAIQTDFIEARSTLLAIMNDNALYSPADYLAEARQYGLDISIDKPFSSWQCEDQAECLRVGMVLGDLLDYELGFLSELDTSCIELIAYATHAKTDELTAQIQSYFSAWKPLIGLNDADAARLIRADGVHILLDLSGHKGNCLSVFAWKPAPIQVSALASLSTTGLAEMDYILGDPYATPLSDADLYSENIWQLPESYCCFNTPAINLDINPLPAFTHSFITFGSFNPLNQINDAVVALWARILHAVPNSRLLIKNHQLHDTAARQITYQRFAEQGILPERLILEKDAPLTEQLAAYHQIDIALDTFPHHSTRTSIEALWMAVPVLSCCGASILSNAGLADWIARDDDDYLAKAVYFATDLENLAALRLTLRQQVLDSPLFDAVSFARNFEAALWSMQPQ